MPANTKIVLNGSNTINVSGGLTGIVSHGNLMITGSGSLTINVDSGYGIYSRGKVTISGVTLSITRQVGPVPAGIYSEGGVISIEESTVTIAAGEGKGIGFESGFSLIIKESDLEVTADDGCLRCYSEYLDITPTDKTMVSYGDSKLTASIEKAHSALSANEKIQLVSYSTKYIKITYKDSITPGSPSDKKNESSPFHKFETGSIKEAKASGTIDATGGWKSFDRGTLNELSKLGKDISVTYDFNGHTYCVVVPKGFDPQKLVNEEGYCGFLYLAKVYGAVMIK